MHQAPGVYIGIDVSKDRLEVAVEGSPASLACHNREAEVAALVEQLVRLQPQRVVCEATGGYELNLVLAAVEAGLPLVVANPRQVRDYARATGQRAKTDRLDAQVLARYARVVAPPLRPLPEAQTRELEAWVTRRRQVVGLLAMEKQRLLQARTPAIQASLEGLIQRLQEEVHTLNQRIQALIEQQQAWSARKRLLTSVKGIGETIAAVLLAELPELGRLPPKQIAALAGLAPFNFDSGQLRGQRHIYGGRASVRCALYQAAQVACRFEPYMQHLYQRFIAQHKPHKVAITACARHLLVMLNAMLRDGQPWNPPPIPAQAA
ncbi:MAG: IS110 family transposase [Meiothermus ruber]|uniref:IS110 family transposase n=1 Tax=Meiothermus ruber TaxID=277 RepID=UPI00391B6112